MRNLIGLIDAICDVYDRSDLKPKADGTTFCNVAVQSIATIAFGYNGFYSKTADQMMEFLKDNPDWRKIEMAQAQENANEGSLVVAGLRSIDMGQGNGHVVVIRPGKLCDSGKWGPTPRCVNIGAHNFLARGPNGVMTGLPVGVNEAFRDKPLFYVLRSTL